MTERRRIHAVSIRDFRGINALDLDFRDGVGNPLGLVVVAGANGSGKTSVLEAILSAIGRSDLITRSLADQVRFGAKDGHVMLSVGTANWAVQLLDGVATKPLRRSARRSPLSNTSRRTASFMPSPAIQTRTIIAPTSPHGCRCSSNGSSARTTAA